MDTPPTASITQFALDHALRVARDLGWNVVSTDAKVTLVSEYDARMARQAICWKVSVRICATRNRHRPLARDGHLTGVIRIGDMGLLDTLKESDNALRARLVVDNAE